MEGLREACDKKGKNRACSGLKPRKRKCLFAGCEREFMPDCGAQVFCSESCYEAFLRWRLNYNELQKRFEKSKKLDERIRQTHEAARTVPPFARRTRKASQTKTEKPGSKTKRIKTWPFRLFWFFSTFWFNCQTTTFSLLKRLQSI